MASSCETFFVARRTLGMNILPRSSSSLVVPSAGRGPVVPPIWFGALALGLGLPLVGVAGTSVASSPLAWLAIVLVARAAGLDTTP